MGKMILRKYFFTAREARQGEFLHNSQKLSNEINSPFCHEHKLIYKNVVWTIEGIFFEYHMSKLDEELLPFSNHFGTKNRREM